MTWTRHLSGTTRPSLIVGGPGALDRLPAEAVRAADRGSRLHVLTDDNVGAAWGDAVLGRLRPSARREDLFSLEPGEKSKSVETVSRCWEWLASRGARRNDIVIALGGGVIGDVGGFAAATHLRGMGLWQIPTTLLAQVDSSVGGKNGVNLSAGKNLVGSFYQPDLVVIDPDTLSTLPEAEYLNGLGEVVKYGLLCGEDFFSLLEDNVQSIRLRDPVLISALVERCVNYKAAVVEEDEFDEGGRAVLNLGHTTGHALESALGYGYLGHGYAVALGLLVALALSERLLGLDRAVRRRTGGLLTALGLPLKVEIPETGALMEAAFRDKKIVDERLLFVGLTAVGSPLRGMDVPVALFEEALGVIKS